MLKLMPPFFILALHLSITLSCFSAHSADFSVSPSADSDCSDLICDLQSALTEATQNGQDDTILLAEGTYEPTIPIGNIPNYSPAPSEMFSLSLIGAGTDLTVLDGTSLGEGVGILWLWSGGEKILIKGMTFQNGILSDLPGIFIEGNGPITIEDCEFKNNAGGAYVSGTPVNVSNNNFFDNITNNYGGLKITLNTDAVIVEHNIFTGNSGGINVLFSGSSLALQDNVLTKNLAEAISISGSMSDATLLLANNTIVQNQSSSNSAVTAGILIVSDGDTSEVNIYNNIAVESTSPSAQPIADISFNGGIDFNGDGKGNTLHLKNNNFGRLSTSCFEGCSIPKEESANIRKDSLFVDPANGDFHLQSNSPCINTGLNDGTFELPELDLDGNPRLFGSAPDMGAYELQSEPTGSASSSSSGGCSLVLF